RWTFYEAIKLGNVNHSAVPQMGCGPGAEAIPPMTGSLRLGWARLIKSGVTRKEKVLPFRLLPAIK
ncbi:MAG: hypothetical protein NTY64_10815, partial [Deltaproteobacteria bacterium]|nr:hypothetical protein [Deltaproteobacteria bacterium]